MPVLPTRAWEPLKADSGLYNSTHLSGAPLGQAQQKDNRSFDDGDGRRQFSQQEIDCLPRSAFVVHRPAVSSYFADDAEDVGSRHRRVATVSAVALGQQMLLSIN